VLSLLAVTALVAAGCGAVGRVTEGNPATGKALFIAKCGACHTLANAKTQGTVGPNLDDAFGAVKAQGFRLTTITDVVRGQIAYPDTREGTICKRGLREKAGLGLSCSTTTGMTANLVHGQDAKDVAVYVAFCAEVLTQNTGVLHPDPRCTTANETVKVPSS
jgi:hypothetical protein